MMKKHINNFTYTPNFKNVKYSSFFTKALLIIILLPAIQSCSKWSNLVEAFSNNIMHGTDNTKTYNTQFNLFGKTFNNPEKIPIWEAQIKKIMEYNDVIEKKDLKLLGYNYLGAIKNQTELTSLKLRMPNVFLFYSRSIQLFKVGVNVLKKEEYIQWLNSILPNDTTIKAVPVEKDPALNHRVENYLSTQAGELAYIELQWRNNNTIHKSICIASMKRGIIYDNFLYFLSNKDFDIPTLHANESNTFKKNAAKSIQHSYDKVSYWGGIEPDEVGGVEPNETENNGSEGGDLIKEYVNNNTEFNMFGSVSYQHRIYAAAIGKYINRKKHMTTYQLFASSNAPFINPFFKYSINATVKSIAFKAGENGYLRFAWAWVVSPGSVNLGIKWNGFSFDLPIAGDAKSQQGEEYISSSDLVERFPKTTF